MFAMGLADSDASDQNGFVSINSVVTVIVISHTSDMPTPLYLIARVKLLHGAIFLCSRYLIGCFSPLLGANRKDFLSIYLVDYLGYTTVKYYESK